MNILKWYEAAKEPGMYWVFGGDYESILDTDEFRIIEIREHSLYMFAGSETDHDLEDDYGIGNYNFIRAERPSLESHWALHIFKQERRFELLNNDAEFEPGREGFWREREDVGQSEGMLPWPVVWEHPKFKRQEFIDMLADIETHRALEINLKGAHKCRLSGSDFGNYEYEYKDWTWPEGLIGYVRMGVLPSRAFYAFIMGVSEENCKYLPTYNRK